MSRFDTLRDDLRGFDGQNSNDIPGASTDTYSQTQFGVGQLLRAAYRGGQPMIGRRFGAYRVTDYIDRGGFAAVYLAERADLVKVHRRAAVKVMRDACGELALQSFHREREMLAALDHPGIVQLIEGGFTDTGTPFLITEYVQGVSMREYAAMHSLDADQRLALFVAVCRAVGAAHRQRIVHRDIKPSNILITDEGQVKLLDFGAARRVSNDDLCHSGRSFTPAYAAPEQFEGGRAGLSTDVYGLGVVLQELLIGVNSVSLVPRAPSKLLGLRTRTAEDKKLKAMLHGGLDRIILTALAPAPRLRHPTADALADEILQFLHQGSSPKSHFPSVHNFRRRIRWPWRHFCSAKSDPLVKRPSRWAS